MSRCGWMRPCSAPLDVKHARSNPPLPAPCMPVRQRPRLNWKVWVGITSNAMGKPRTIALSSSDYGVDIDVTPLPIGAKAEGSERTWMGRCRSKTGRKVLRVTASDYREVLHEILLRGKASALPTLKAALRELEARLHWTRARRAQIVLRLDGGFG